MHLVDSDTLPHRADLPPGGVECVGSPETRRLEGRLVTGGKVVRNLEPELVPPDRTKAGKDVIHGRGPVGPGRGEFFVGIGDGESLLIVLDHFRQRVARRDPVAETGDIHRGHVPFAFALGHPLREHQPDAAALAEAGHDAAGRPVIPQARNRSDKGVAIGGKCKRTMDHGFHPRRLQHRESLVGKGDAVLDLVEIIRQQFVAEIPGRTVHGPGTAGLLVEPDAQPASLLPQVTLACGVHDMRVLFGAVADFRDLVGDDVLVLHRVERQVAAGHGRHFARPKPRRIDKMLRNDGALVGHNLPPIQMRIGLQHLAM